jgi:3-hydroxymyristoyl/3-hydroxydecanoyl-(acyl carrier protein) dehydratase
LKILETSDHFAAFSFVDRITGLEPGLRARGTFAIPPHIEAFPPCLMAEAVGQLAAWVAMAHIGFRGRPVAALALETLFLRGARPGRRLDLAVEIENCDDEAVAYGGTGDIDGARAIELKQCLGPMLPGADFDDPEALAARFALLCDGGAAPGRFHGVELPRVSRESGVPGQSAIGTLQVPHAARFFNDHFPKRPVFPATLLLDAQIDLALRVAAESPHWPAHTPLTPVRMTNVKVRSFTPPGQTLTVTAQMRPPKGEIATFMLSAEADGKTVATTRVDIAPGRDTP